MVGAPAARFFNRVAELLEQPEQLLGVPGEPTRRA
jgi:pyruvate/2-oxoglutarate dehydrogenase complex dihydrolipoamide acyltransferase (E2) component